MKMRSEINDTVEISENSEVLQVSGGYMNVFDLGHKAISACETFFSSFADIQAKDIPDQICKTCVGVMVWRDPLLENSPRCSSDLRWTVPVARCPRDQQIMLTNRKMLFGQTDQRGEESQ